MKKIICLYGGPGAGKSTTCAGLFYNLKRKGYDCEMNREFVKEWVWEGRNIKQGDQSYFFSKQARKERIYMENGLEFIITDSPLLLSHFYGLKYDSVEQKYNTSKNMLNDHYGLCSNLGYEIEHFLLKRPETYNPNGRFEDFKTACQFDLDIKKMLVDFNIEFKEVENSEETCDTIMNFLGV